MRLASPGSALPAATTNPGIQGGLCPLCREGQRQKPTEEAKISEDCSCLSQGAPA